MKGKVLPGRVLERAQLEVVAGSYTSGVACGY
jgi:hypothetical protein